MMRFPTGNASDRVDGLIRWEFFQDRGAGENVTADSWWEIEWRLRPTSTELHDRGGAGGYSSVSRKSTSDAIVECENSVVSDTCLPDVFSISVTRRKASSELPPMSKKLS